MKLTEDSIKEFENKLYLNEKSKATVMKYSAALHKLKNYLKENEITKQRLLEYRDILLQKKQGTDSKRYIIRNKRISGLCRAARDAYKAFKGATPGFYG